MRSSPGTVLPDLGRIAAASVVVLTLIGAGLLVGCGASDQAAPVVQVVQSPTSAPSAPTPVAPSATATATPIPPAPTATATPTPLPMPTAVPSTVPGLGVLVNADFIALDGQRVAVMANQTSTFDGAHIVDLLHDAPNVDLVAILAAEHGVRGDVQAGEQVDDDIDARTGTPVFSVYGATRKPTPQMLEGIDVIVYDLQDAGARFYTFISSMGLAMQAAAEANAAFVVLDRPNPLGGRVSGFMRDEAHVSFVGQYPVPALYGLTAGELARAIQGERWLSGMDDLNLTIVALDNWSPTMTYVDTGLGWTAPSPGLPTVDAVLAYPGTVLFEATTISYGVGTEAPFTTIGAPWSDGVSLAFALNELAATRADMAGVRFEPVDFTPSSAFAPAPRYEGVTMSGVRYRVIDPHGFDPVVVGVAVLQALRDQARATDAGPLIDRPDFFDLLAGTRELRALVEGDAPLDHIVDAWLDGVTQFRSTVDRYRLYE